MDKTLELLAQTSMKPGGSAFAEFLKSASPIIEEAVITHMQFWRDDPTILVRSRPTAIRVAYTCKEWFQKVQLLAAFIQSPDCSIGVSVKKLIFRPLACAVTHSLLSDDSFALPEPTNKELEKAPAKNLAIVNDCDRSDGYWQGVTKLAFKFLSDFRLACSDKNDISQEAVMEIVKKVQAGEQIRSLENLLRPIVRNKAISFIRQKTREMQQLDYEVCDDSAENSAIDHAQLLKLCKVRSDQLPELSRQLIIARLVDALPPREIIQKLFYLGFERLPTNLSQRLLDIEGSLRRMADKHDEEFVGPAKSGGFFD